MKASNRKITLPQVCWQMVKDVLGEPGWATDYTMIVVAGTIDLTKKIPIVQMPKKITPENEKIWADKEITIDLMAKEIEVIAAAIQFHVKKGSFRGNKYSKQLIEEFIDL